MYNWMQNYFKGKNCSFSKLNFFSDFSPLWIFYFQAPICTFLGGMKSWSIQIRQRLIFKYPYISVMSHISANFFPFHFFLQSNQNLGYELRTIWTKSFEGSWEHLSFPLWSCVFAYKEFVHPITMTSHQFLFKSVPQEKIFFTKKMATRKHCLL